MRFIPLYQPAGAPKARLLKAWARRTIVVIVLIPAIYYAIRLYFGFMPVAENVLRHMGAIH